MSENFNSYNNYNNYDNDCGCHHDHKKDHKKKKSENCECECVEGLAKALREFKCQYIYAFEKNAVIIGKVKFVKDSSVLVLEDGWKYVDGLGLFGFQKIFISICKLTEFIPVYGGPTAVEAAINNLKESKKNQII